MLSVVRKYYQRIKGFNRNIRLFLWAMLLGNIGITFWFLLFNLYLQEGGYDKKSIGDVLMIGNLATALLALPAGYLGSRYNHKVMLIIGQVCSSIAFLGVVSTLEKTSLFTLVFLAFVTLTFSRVVMGPFIMRNSTPVERPYIFSINFVIVFCGGVFGSLVAGLTKDAITCLGISSFLAYRYTLLIGILLSVTAVIPLLRIQTKKVNKADEKLIKLSEIARWNWFLFIKAIIPISILAVGAGLMFQFVNLYFKDVFDSTDSAIGIYISLRSVALALGVLVAPIVAEKIGKVKTVIIAEVGAIPFMIVLALTNNVVVAVIALLLRSFVLSMAFPVYVNFFLELCRKEEQGIYQALDMITWAVSLAIAAVLFGQVFKDDYTTMFLVSAGLYLVAAVVYYLFFYKEEKKLEPIKKPELRATPRYPGIVS